MVPIIYCYFVAVLILFSGNMSWAAMGCTLRNPDRDIRRLFPTYTGYRTSFITVKEMGGMRLFKEIERRLGDRLEPVYENMDVPYAFYTVLQGKQIIGHVHGVNQKGEFGGMQLILATDQQGKILHFYYQSLTGPDRRLFRNKEFTEQFKALTVYDFHQYEPTKGEITNPLSPLTRVKNPGARNDIDFRATLRGLKKNLIIFDLLFLRDTRN